MATGPANQVLLLQGCYFFDSITLLLASLDRGDGDRNSSSCYAAVFIVPHRIHLNNYLQKHLVGLLTIRFNILYNMSNFVLASVKCIILIKFKSNYPKLMQSVLEKNLPLLSLISVEPSDHPFLNSWVNRFTKSSLQLRV